ncbi:MAG: T9SS type A sorting domain-containing protein [Bacteroidales bacterium]|nr:T9SS type A sorting domain-containing protein [Bacteroidales bacterium]
MKKIIALLLVVTGFAMISMAQISFDEVAVDAWYGSGDHEVMFVVDFDSDPIGVDSAFAWGIKFDIDSISGVEIMDLIALLNPNFSYSGTGFLDNISYTTNGQNYTNPNAGWFSILESNDGETWAWNSGIHDNVGNAQWFGIVVMNPDTWEAEINVPLLETGIENLHAYDVNVFPNPASERLYIDWDQEATVNLMNLSGQTVYSSSGRINIIDVTNFSPGFYVLTIVVDAKTSIQKVMVK